MSSGKNECTFRSFRITLAFLENLCLDTSTLKGNLKREDLKLLRGWKVFLIDMHKLLNIEMTCSMHIKHL